MLLLDRVRVKARTLPFFLGFGDGPHRTNRPTAMAKPTPANIAILSTSIIRFISLSRRSFTNGTVVLTYVHSSSRNSLFRYLFEHASEAIKILPRILTIKIRVDEIYNFDDEFPWRYFFTRRATRVYAYANDWTRAICKVSSNDRCKYDK